MAAVPAAQRGCDSRTGCHRHLPVRRLPPNAKGLNGTFDVLQCKAAKIVKGRLHPASHGFMDGARDHNAARWRFASNRAATLTPSP